MCNLHRRPRGVLGGTLLLSGGGGGGVAVHPGAFGERQHRRRICRVDHIRPHGGPHMRLPVGEHLLSRTQAQFSIAWSSTVRIPSNDAMVLSNNPYLGSGYLHCVRQHLQAAGRESDLISRHLVPCTT